MTTSAARKRCMTPRTAARWFGLAVFCSLSIALADAPAAATHWTADTAHSGLTFSAVQAGARFEAQGKLTIRDVTRPVRLPFTFVVAADGRTARLSGGTTIQRLDFGVGQGEWNDTTWVGNAVDIHFDLALTRAAGAVATGTASAAAH